MTTLNFSVRFAEWDSFETIYLKSILITISRRTTKLEKEETELNKEKGFFLKECLVAMQASN